MKRRPSSKMILREITSISDEGARKTGYALEGTQVFRYVKTIFDYLTIDDKENKEIIKRHIKNPEGRIFELMKSGGKRGFWPGHWRGTI